jgi:hypothetical protein
LYVGLRVKLGMTLFYRKAVVTATQITKNPASITENRGGKQPRSCSRRDGSAWLFCFGAEHKGFDSAAGQP